MHELVEDFKRIFDTLLSTRFGADRGGPQRVLFQGLSLKHHGGGEEFGT